LQTRESTSRELADVQAVQGKLDAIDRRFPRPEIPDGASQAKALRVLPPGAVELRDGGVARLDGIGCFAGGLDYLA
jgi:hypothetical protein